MEPTMQNIIDWVYDKITTQLPTNTIGDSAKWDKVKFESYPAVTVVYSGFSFNNPGTNIENLKNHLIDIKVRSPFAQQLSEGAYNDVQDAADEIVKLFDQYYTASDFTDVNKIYITQADHRTVVSEAGVGRIAILRLNFEIFNNI